MQDMLSTVPMAQPIAPPPMNNTYDEVPYESHPFSQTHPERLFTVGTLFGLRPTPVHKCRVLELGCAAGGNLIPMAEYLPESQFIGCDLSARQINMGQEWIGQLGLKNLALKQVDINAIDDSWGTFDYIIAHGVFSWVKHEIQEKIFETAPSNSHRTASPTSRTTRIPAGGCAA